MYSFFKKSILRCEVHTNLKTVMFFILARNNMPFTNMLHPFRTTHFNHITALWSITNQTVFYLKPGESPRAIITSNGPIMTIRHGAAVYYHSSPGTSRMALIIGLEVIIALGQLPPQTCRLRPSGSALPCFITPVRELHEWPS